jgi:CubicO group peptidase (beta-lactamase class C family)
MKQFLLLLCFLPTLVLSQNLYFPPNTASNWDTISPASLGWCEERVDSLIDFMETTNSKAFMVLKDGKIVIEEYFGTFTADSLWYWASAGKTLTAFTVGLAQEDGFLNINDTSSQYLGQGWTATTPAQEAEITIWNQLTMTSGLDDGVPDHYCTIDSCLIYKDAAGSRWAYHNAPYTLLDQVIANATGQSLNQYFSQKVRNPIGMNGAFFQVGYNNLYLSNARSMARFGLLMLANGVWDGNTIMQDSLYFNAMINSSQSLNESYGYLWWLNGKSSFMLPQLQLVFPGSLNPNAPNDMYAAMGKNGQLINVVPSQNLILIRMGDSPGSTVEVPALYNDDIWEYVNALTNCTTNVNSTEEQAYLQIYPNPTTGLLSIESAGNITAYQLYNSLGQIMETKLTKEERQIQLDLSAYPNGVYQLQLEIGDDLFSKRIILQR